MPSRRVLLPVALLFLNVALLASAQPAMAEKSGPTGHCGYCYDQGGQLAACCHYGCEGSNCCTTAQQCA